jgi:predicted ferric reductase
MSFWLGMFAGLVLWWVDTPTASVDSTPAALIEAGRITGLIAGYVLLVQILLMSRVGWLDRRVSANALVGLHRDLGGLLVVMVLAHATFTIVGYARTEGVSFVGETKTMLTTYEDMISAFVATGILIAVALLAIRAIRTLMPYELWHFLHLTSYAVLLLTYGHQFATGRDLHDVGIGRVFWISLYVFVLVCLVWGRLVAPLKLNLRHRLQVASVVHEGQDMLSRHLCGACLSPRDRDPGADPKACR